MRLASPHVASRRFIMVVDMAINISLPDIISTRRYIFIPLVSMPSVVSSLPASIGDVSPSFGASNRSPTHGGGSLLRRRAYIRQYIIIIAYLWES